MAETLLRMLCDATIGLALVLLLRRPARRAFGAGPAFILWLLPVVLALAPLLPREWAPAAMVVLPGLTVTPHAAATAASPGVAIDWTQVLPGLWLVGAALGLLRLALHYSRLRCGMRAAPDEWSRWLPRCAPGLDPRRLRVHPAGPAVLWALPRSLVLLPADFTSHFDNAVVRELVLRHELAHARRGDALWSLAMEIASALLWFHPLAWLARSRFRLDQELACDAAALRESPQRTAHYAHALLDSAAVQPMPVLLPWLAEPQLKERIAMITRIPPGALRRRFGLLAVAAMLAGGLYVAGGQASALAAVPTDASAPSVDVTWKNQHPPHYPIGAIQKGEQGVVVLDVTIDAQGDVANITVDPAGTTAHVTLQDAAVQAAKGWRYAPAHKDGKSVGGVVRIPVKFSLTSVDPDADRSSSLPSVDVQYKNRNPPAYPVEAIQKGEQGMVLLDVTIDATGRVTGVAIDPARTTAPLVLQTAAIQAATNWKFRAGVKDGRPVGGTVEIPVNFSLSGESSGNSQSCPAGFTYKQGIGKSFSCEATFDKCAITTDSGRRDSVQAASCTEGPAATHTDASS